MESERLVLWFTFNLFVLGMLALDLGVFHRKAHAVSMKEASLWSVVWVALAMAFNLGIYYAWGSEKALEFLTGYVIEKSLSVDNLFVFLMVFQYFATPAEYQHRVLFWGIVGALILRAIFIALGSALLDNFHWMIYVFGAFLIFTGIRMLLQGDEKLEPEKNPVVRLFRRCTPVSPSYHGQTFFITKDGKKHATLLMLVLIVIETTDVIFAVDSIPAIFAITQDPFIVYTSNVFAILGLRALYFLLAGIMGTFVYLKVGLSVVLCFVGAKMALVDLYKVPIGISLAVIGAVLSITIIASLLAPAVQRWRQRRAGFDTASGRPQHPTLLLPFRVATVSFAILLFAAILLAVKLHSIAQGATGREAITVIALAERRLAEARWQDSGHRHASLSAAAAALGEAWSSLDARRYHEAIRAGRAASELLDSTADGNTELREERMKEEILTPGRVNS
jgi:tellurite resistance protein TerC